MSAPGRTQLSTARPGRRVAPPPPLSLSSELTHTLSGVPSTSPVGVLMVSLSQMWTARGALLICSWPTPGPTCASETQVVGPAPRKVLGSDHPSSGQEGPCG